MKYLHLFIAILVASCAPVELSTATHPGKFVVTEFAPDGAKRAVYSTTQYSESGFPPAISFKDSRGNTVKIKGSYLIEKH